MSAAAAATPVADGGPAGAAPRDARASLESDDFGGGAEGGGAPDASGCNTGARTLEVAPRTREGPARRGRQLLPGARALLSFATRSIARFVPSAAAAVNLLRAWLDARQATPYPSTVERKALAAAGGISVEQVTYWLSGQRRAARRGPPKVCCALRHVHARVCEPRSSFRRPGRRRARKSGTAGASCAVGECWRCGRPHPQENTLDLIG